MKIGMFGTFDVGNFGDILFPIIAEKKLAALGHFEIEKFSFRKCSAATWCYDVTPMEELPSRIADLDLVIVGGGHLVHFNPNMQKGYKPNTPDIPHPLGFWWLPALAGASAGLPVALHGVSTDPYFPDWASTLMVAFVDSLTVATVRDEQSRLRLQAFNKSEKSIEILPDSVFSLPDLVTRSDHSPALTSFLNAVGVSGKYLIIQPSYVLRPHMAEIERLVIEAKNKGWDVLELPIGAELFNDIGFYPDSWGVKRITTWPEPFVLAEVIANAEAVCGVSLHLSIVASCYGIPVFRPAYSRTSKYITIDGLANISFFGSDKPLRGWSDTVPDLSPITERRALLDGHWRRLAALAEARSATPRRVVGWEMLCATPDAFKNLATGKDKIAAVRQSATRKRNFVTIAVKQRLGI